MPWLVYQRARGCYAVTPHWSWHAPRGLARQMYVVDGVERRVAADVAATASLQHDSCKTFAPWYIVYIFFAFQGGLGVPSRTLLVFARPVV